MRAALGIKQNGTQRISYAYDNLSRLNTRTLNTTTPFVTQYGYHQGATAGTTTTLVKTVQNGNDTYEYSYDSLGNITQIKLNGTVYESYTYDALSQLSTVTRGNDVYTYTYDNGGNIQSVKKNGTTVKSYGYNDQNWYDLLTQFNGDTITYDEIGNPLQYRDGFEFTWSNGRQLKKVTEGTLATTYTYNADGLRATKNQYGMFLTQYYWLDGVLIGEKTGDEYIIYLYDDTGTPYGLIYDGIYYYYVQNAQGDIVALLDADGNIVAKYTYDAWGNILSITDSNNNRITNGGHIAHKNPLRYRGYYYDEETEFYYLQSRYYDPVTGRFINADGLISTGQGILGYNMFAYCGNNPINRVDPSGHAWGVLAAIAEIAIAIVVVVVIAVVAQVIFSPQSQDAATQFGDSIARGISSLISKFKGKDEAKEDDVASSPPPDTKTYYHVTSPEIAAKIIATNTITAGEGGYVYAWQKIPNNNAINNSGSRYTGRGTVTIAFETIVAFEPDTTMNEYTYAFGPVRTCFSGSIIVSNPRIVKSN